LNLAVAVCFFDQRIYMNDNTYEESFIMKLLM